MHLLVEAQNDALSCDDALSCGGARCHLLGVAGVKVQAVGAQQMLLPSLLSHAVGVLAGTGAHDPDAAGEQGPGLR